MTQEVSTATMSKMRSKGQGFDDWMRFSPVEVICDGCNQRTSFESQPMMLIIV